MCAVRVLELYCGIGGMHFALNESGVSAEVVAAIDINTTTNQIYRHNFPQTPLWNKTIEGVPLEDFNGLAFDMILMSPPCQPFTRLGLHGDISDPRTNSFLYILRLLLRLDKLPHYVLLENVKGFETSSARECLVKTLTDCGYFYQEFLISPTSIGIPNSRLRYFLIAKLSAEKSSVHESPKASCPPAHPTQTRDPADSANRTPASNPPQTPDLGPAYRRADCEADRPHVLYKLETAEALQRKIHQDSDEHVRQIQEFLQPEVDLERFLLRPKTLLKYSLILDIVQPKSRRSICFTKNYGRYMKGTGSVLQCSVDTEIQEVYAGLDQLPEEEKVQKLLKLNLRYFTPKEVANLMGFPETMTFPENISTMQQYKALGNSLNVIVVSRLLRLLVSPQFGLPGQEKQFGLSSDLCSGATGQL